MLALFAVGSVIIAADSAPIAAVAIAAAFALPSERPLVAAFGFSPKYHWEASGHWS